MSEHTAPYLRIVRSAPDSPSSADSTTASPTSDNAEAAATASATALSQPSDTPLNQPLTQAIMYAAVSWVALCAERVVYAVDIQPIARRLYEVSVHYASWKPTLLLLTQMQTQTQTHAKGQTENAGEGIILRVRLEVEPGLALRTVVDMSDESAEHLMHKRIDWLAGLKEIKET